MDIKKELTGVNLLCIANHSVKKLRNGRENVNNLVEIRILQIILVYFHLIHIEMKNRQLSYFLGISGKLAWGSHCRRQENAEMEIVAIFL